MALLSGRLDGARIGSLTFLGNVQRFPVPKARPGRARSVRSPGPSPLRVVCAARYGEAELKQLRLKDLHQIVIDHGLGGYKGKTKSQLAKQILKNPPDVDLFVYASGGKKFPDGEAAEAQLDAGVVAFSSREELLTKLSQFTVLELRTELRKRRMTVSGRKMVIVERLAARLEQEKARQKPITESLQLGVENTETLEPLSMEKVNSMSEDEMRTLLRERVGSDVNFSKFLDVQPFVESAARRAALQGAGPVAETEASLTQFIEDGMHAICPENENFLSLVKRCDAMGLERREEDSREDILAKLEEHAAEKRLQFTGGGAKQKVLEQLKAWLQEIQSSLSSQTVKDVLPAEGLKRLEEAGIQAATPQNWSQLLEGLEMIESDVFLRSVALLSSQITYLVLKLPVVQLQQIFPTGDEDPIAIKSFLQEVFLKTTLDVFGELYQSAMDQQEEVKALLHPPVPEEVSLEEADVCEAADPAVSLGIVFGGAASRLADEFSSVRCLFDNLQTAPYATDPLDRGIRDKGISVAIYCISVGADRGAVYRMSPAEFLCIDASSFVRFRQGARVHPGVRFADYSLFLEELKSLDHCISLTGSLDVLASEVRQDAEFLAQMDGMFLGSGYTSRRLTQNRFGCLTFLRSRGFTVPPIHRFQKKDLEDLISWNQGFEHWCRYHGLDHERGSFQLRASHPHGRHPRLRCTGIADLVKTAETLLQTQGMEEVMIQPDMKAGTYVEFSCVVLQSENGPVALTPTEFEILPETLVRSLSSPLRKHMPPRLTAEKVEAMRQVSVKVFQELKLSGYACIHGRILIDPEKQRALETEELTYPQTVEVSDMPSPYQDVTLPPELLEHMESLYLAKEKEYDALIESFDNSRYTLEALRYMEFLDQGDAEEGIQRNRYKEYAAIIETLRHRKELEVAEPRPSQKELAGWEADLQRALTKEEPRPNRALCRGDDFSLAVTGVDSTLSFAADSLVFQQAAVAGLTHSAVLRHLLNQRRRFHGQLQEMVVASKEWNPLWPENYPEEKVEPDAGRPVQIWILCGGDGTGHQASLASGINALMKLRIVGDVQPYLFVMDSGRRMGATPEVLRALQKRRKTLLDKGVPVEALPEECSDAYLSSPRIVDREMAWKPVWCLHDGHCLRPTIDEALESSERYRRMQNSADITHTTLTKDFKQMLLKVQSELHAAGLPGVSSAWAGKIDECPPNARMMTMDVFATEAARVGALIYVAVHGDIAQDGTLQDFLNSYRLTYTGCHVTACQLCGDKEELSQHLRQLDLVSTLLQRRVTREELLQCAQDTEVANALFHQTTVLMGRVSALCLKPTSDGFGGGVVKIAAPEDLCVYGTALEKKLEAIYSEQLTAPHCTVSMPKPQATAYIFEPYIPPAVPFRNANGDLVVTEEQRHIEVSFGLIGEFGRMWILTPSMILTNLETNDSVEDRYVAGTKSALTPIPETIVHPRFVEAAKKRVEELGDVLGLRGVARVDAFMDRGTGELSIIEVDINPYVGEHSLILQQAALEDPPMFPGEVFLNIVEAAVEQEAESFEEEPVASTEGGDRVPGLSPWDDNEFWETDTLTSQPRLEDSIGPQESLSNLWGSDDDEDALLGNSEVQDTYDSPS